MKSIRVLRLRLAADSCTFVVCENGLLSIYHRPTVRRSLPALSAGPGNLRGAQPRPHGAGSWSQLPSLFYWLYSTDCRPFKQLILDGVIMKPGVNVVPPDNTLAELELTLPPS
jgi:hypothetical protein